MARAPGRFISVEDWLAYQGETEARHELIGGRLVPMGLRGTWHASVTNEIGAMCSHALRHRFPARALQGVGLVLGGGRSVKGYVPDLVVTYEAVSRNGPLVAEPRLVVQIVSPSTDRYDQIGRLNDYQSLPTLEEVWLVMSDTPVVLQSVRVAGGWSVPRAFIRGATFTSPVLGATVALADIYRFTPLGRTEPESDLEPE